MKAMIFAAGLGTRLRPLTNDKPKALVTVAGKTLLELAVKKLLRAGCTQVVINIHHFGDLIVDYLEEHAYFGADIQLSDERDLLRDTGGGLKKAAPLLGDRPFIVYNVDVLTDMDLTKMYAAHMASTAPATLAVRRRTSSRYLLFDRAMKLTGWQNVKKQAFKMCRPSEDWTPYAFSGIHVVNPDIFDYMPDEEVFSIIDVYLAAGKSMDILGYDHTDSFWMDVGRLNDLEKAREKKHLFIN